MRRKKLGCALLGIFLYALAFAQIIPRDTAVHPGVLENGFTYYIRHNSEPQGRVYLYLVNKVGSILEEENQRGLAHFIEHMSFNGTSHFPKNELVNYLQKSGVRFGADLNAYTDFDETVYQLPLPTNDASVLENGFQIIRDWAKDATLDSVEINNERGVVLEEERLSRGAQERMRKIYFPVLVNNSRYGFRNPIGTLDIVKNFPPSAIRKFYTDWYRPDLQALIVVGDIDVNRAELVIKKLFSNLKNPANEKIRNSYGIPLNGENHFLIVTDREMSSTSMQIIIKHGRQAMFTEEDYKTALERTLFNQMLAERFATLSQRTNIPFIQVQAAIGEFWGNLDAFSLNAVLKPGKIRDGLESTWQVIEQVKQFGFSESELKRAKQSYMSSLEAIYREKEKTNSESYIAQYQSLFLENRAVPGIEWEYHFVRNQIDHITLASMSDLSKEYIRNTDRDILILAPETDRSSLPDSVTFSKWLTDIACGTSPAYVDEDLSQKLMSIAPVPGGIVKTRTIPDLNITEFTLSNGARVILKPTEFKNDEIIFSAYSPGGTSIYNEKDFINAANAGIIAEMGVSQYNPSQLNKILNGKIINVKPFINERIQGIGGFSTRTDLETALQMTWLRFTQPRIDTTIFNNIISNSLVMLASRDSDPASVFSDTINAALGNHNFRYMPPTSAKLKAVSLPRMFDIYSKMFSDASGFTFVFVGNFKVDSIRTLLEKYIGSLPALHKKELARDLGIQIPAGKFTKRIYRGHEDKATISIVVSGDYIYGPENNMLLQALKEILTIKIIQDLREKESEVYSPNVQLTFNKNPLNRFAFTIGFGCAPQNAKHLTDEALKVMAGLRLYGPSMEDLNKFKSEFKRTRELRMRDNGAWLAYINDYVQNDGNPDDILHEEYFINRMKPLQIQQAAKLWLTGKNVISFELLPEIKSDKTD